MARPPRPRRLAGLYSFPSSPFVEAVGMRRGSTLDGYAQIMWLPPLVAVMAAAEAMAGARWWCYVVNGVQAVHCAMEIAAQQDLTSLGGKRFRVGRWLNGIAMATWDKRVRITPPGLAAFAALGSVLLGVLGLGLPRGATGAPLAVCWAAGVLYCAITMRLFTNEITSGSMAAPRWSQLVYAWAKRLIWPFLAAGGLGALAIAHAARGVGRPAELPWMALTCLVPLLFDLENTLVDRVLRAAELEHRESLAADRARLARTAADVAGRLGGIATAELRRSSAGPAADNAAAALADLTDIGGLLDGTGPVAPLPREVVARLLRAALAPWPGAGEVRVSTDRLSIWEAELCMRVIRRLAGALAVRPAGARDLLDIDLTSDAVIRLTCVPRLALGAGEADALAATLEAAVSAGGGRVERIGLASRAHQDTGKALDRTGDRRGDQCAGGIGAGAAPAGAGFAVVWPLARRRGE